MQVRRARPEELPALGELTVAAYSDFTLGPDDPYVARLRDTAARDAQGELWVAVEDEELLGCVTWCPAGSTWREIALDDEGEFRMLAVAAAARGRGVGEALVRACLDRARADGLGGVAISTMDRMTDAHRLYGRLGFSRVPEADWSPVDGVSLLAFRVRF